jgi:type II secretory pathway pseudopilin PulG
VELIITMAVMAILVAGLYVASKPQKRIGETNDAKRKNDAQAIEQAIKVVATDSGVMPSELKTLTENTPFAIVKAGGLVSGTYSCTALGTSLVKKDISASLLSVLPQMPIDPELTSTSNETGYYIVRRGSSYDVEPCNTYRLAATSGTKQMCGDGYCGTTESCSSCPQDCGACPAVCGNDICEAGETCSGCIADCEGHKADCNDISGVSYLCAPYNDVGSLVPTCRPVCVAEGGAAVCFYQDCPQEYGSEPEADCSFVGQDICCSFP